MARGSPLDTAPHAGADLPKGIPIGQRELCTYFPHSYQRPDVMNRARHEGWGASTLAKAQILARANSVDAKDIAKRTDALRQQALVAKAAYSAKGKEFPGIPFSKRATPAFGKISDFYICNDFAHGKTASTGPPKLKQVVAGVVSHPEGDDEGPLTQALEYAMWKGVEFLAEHDINDLNWILAEIEVKVPKDVETREWDKEALFRLSLVTNPQ